MTANLRRRKIYSRIFETLCALAVIVALIPLAMILFYVVREGFGALNLDFFTKMPKPVGESGGGMANAIAGTLILIGIAAAFAVPVGCFCGIHLSEYPGTKFSSVVRFAERAPEAEHDRADDPAASESDRHFDRFPTRRAEGVRRFALRRGNVLEDFARDG